jgi:hypothetical protein
MEQVLFQKTFETRRKMRTLIKNMIKETIGNETSQAIIRIFDTDYLGLRIFWLICLLGCGSLCFYLVAQTFLTYLSYPVYTTTKIEHDIPAVFPKVTICNTMPAITEYALNIVKEINEEVSPGLSIFNESHISTISLYDPSDIFLKIWNIFMGRINRDTFSDSERKKLVHSFEDILWDCVFNGETCSSSDFKWHWNKFYGNCYVFNSGFNESGHPVSFKKSTLSDVKLGLQLIMYVGYNEKLNFFNTGWNNYMPFSNSYGLNVLIENNTYLSNGIKNSIALNGGTLNYISTQRRFSSSLPKPYSDCDIDNANPSRIDSPYFNLILHSSYQYTQELCIIQCIQKQVIQMCNCSIPIYLDLYNVSCKTDLESICALRSIYNGQLKSIIPNCVPHCPLECNSTDYAFSLTSQTSSGIGYQKLIEETPIFLSDFNSTPITVETASNKFVQLFIYYDSLKYTSSTDTPSMDIVTLLGNIGGTLGLFLGISALSICELLHVLVEICLLSKKRFEESKTNSAP